MNRKMFRRTIAACALLLAAALPALAQPSPLNPLKTRIEAGELVLGAFLAAPSTQNAQVIARSGLDFLIVDLEHGAITVSEAQAIVAATQGAPLVPLIRVDKIDPLATKHAADTGAFGIVFPMVRDAEEAKLAMASLRYPPAGVRGIGPALAALRWNLPVPEYINQANDNMLAVLLIEQREALENLDTILQVPGVDVVFVAPFDLSAALGFPAQITHPNVLAAIEKIEAAAKRHKVALGGIGLNAERTNSLIEKGYRFIAITSDVGLIQMAVGNLLKEIKRK